MDTLRSLESSRSLLILKYGKDAMVEPDIAYPSTYCLDNKRSYVGARPRAGGEWVGGTKWGWDGWGNVAGGLRGWVE